MSKFQSLVSLLFCLVALCFGSGCTTIVVRPAQAPGTETVEAEEFTPEGPVAYGVAVEPAVEYVPAYANALGQPFCVNAYGRMYSYVVGYGMPCTPYVVGHPFWWGPYYVRGWYEQAGLYRGERHYGYGHPGYVAEGHRAHYAAPGAVHAGGYGGHSGYSGRSAAPQAYGGHGSRYAAPAAHPGYSGHPAPMSGGHPTYAPPAVAARPRPSVGGGGGRGGGGRHR